MIGKLVGIGFTAMILSGCMTATEISSVPSNIRENPATGGISFGTGGYMLIAAQAEEINGRLAICGTWMQSDNQSAYTRSKLQLANRVMRSASVSLGKKTVIRDLFYMQEVPESGFAVGAPAKCAVTEVPWQKGIRTNQLNVNIPSFTYQI